ncbi:MAG: prenyltransferase/squalene oxidase repeat-containing protein [Gemmataceae bacterium]
MKPFIIMGLLLSLTPIAPAAPPREPMDEAIDRGLLFLRKAQLTSGGWPISGGGLLPGFGADRGSEGDPAITALSVMAFLSAGHVPGEGRHGEAISQGIRFVMNTQQKNGVFASQWGGMTEMYYHGICTLMLAEVIGITPSALADESRQRLEAAVKVILQGQRINHNRDTGGWRYQVNSPDADLSVTGWQLMALRGARNVGCDVPQERIKLAVRYIQNCHDANSGGYRYTTNSNVTVPCTGTGILALELCGKEYHRSPEALKAGAFILKNNLTPGSAHFFYGIYYTSQGMFQLGDNYWKAYRVKLHDLLLKFNPPRQGGAWFGQGGFDDVRFGPCYCTSMAILALTVEYRYLPIYQRFEEPIERDARDPDK